MEGSGQGLGARAVESRPGLHLRPGFQAWDPEGGVRKRDQEGWAPLWRWNSRGRSEPRVRVFGNCVESGLSHSFIHSVLHSFIPSLDQFFRRRPCPEGLATGLEQESGRGGHGRTNIREHLNPHPTLFLSPTLRSVTWAQLSLARSFGPVLTRGGPGQTHGAACGAPEAWHPAHSGAEKICCCLWHHHWFQCVQGRGQLELPGESRPQAREAGMAAFGGALSDCLAPGLGLTAGPGASILLPVHTSSCQCLARAMQEVGKPGPGANPWWAKHLPLRPRFPSTDR